MTKKEGKQPYRVNLLRIDRLKLALSSSMCQQPLCLGSSVLLAAICSSVKPWACMDVHHPRVSGQQTASEGERLFCSLAARALGVYFHGRLPSGLTRSARLYHSLRTGILACNIYCYGYWCSDLHSVAPRVHAGDSDTCMHINRLQAVLRTSCTLRDMQEHLCGVSITTKVP